MKKKIFRSGVKNRGWAILRPTRCAHNISLKSVQSFQRILVTNTATKTTRISILDLI